MKLIKNKNSFTGFLHAPFIISLVSLFTLLVLSACGGKGPTPQTGDNYNSSSASSSQETDAPTDELSAEEKSELEKARQGAEQAEWEAHRLREEIFRKKSAN